MLRSRYPYRMVHARKESVHFRCDKLGDVLLQYVYNMVDSNTFSMIKKATKKKKLLNNNNKRQERKKHNHYIFPAVTSSDNRAGISWNTQSHRAKLIKVCTLYRVQFWWEQKVETVHWGRNPLLRVSLNLNLQNCQWP